MDIGMMSDCEEDYMYDTCDQIADDFDGFDEFDEVSASEDAPDYLEDFDPLNAVAMGMAFALADEITESKRGAEYSLDEGIDEENRRLASLMTRASDNQERGRLRPFEQYIDDICKGRRKLFEDT